MTNEAFIIVKQEGVKSFAAALWKPQQYEIFVDDQRIGALEAVAPPSTSSESQAL